MQLTIILERDEEGFWARIENVPGFLPNTYGRTLAEVEANLRELLADYFAHEGAREPFFVGFTSESVVFDHVYDLEAFFAEYSILKITSVAKLAGLNASLVRQYASGIKRASETQVRRIEQAVRGLGKSLAQVQLT